MSRKSGHMMLKLPKTCEKESKAKSYVAAPAAPVHGYSSGVSFFIALHFQDEYDTSPICRRLNLAATPQDLQWDIVYS